jgi:hypothetical protein
MSLIIRGGSFANADQDFTAYFFCEDVIIHINRPIYAPYYRAIQKRSDATTPFAVGR